MTDKEAALRNKIKEHANRLRAYHAQAENQKKRGEASYNLSEVSFVMLSDNSSRLFSPGSFFLLHHKRGLKAMFLIVYNINSGLDEIVSGTVDAR